MSNGAHRALIVIDVQNEYFTGKLKIEYPDNRTSLANIVKAMDGAQAAQIPVIVVQQFAPADSPIFAQGSPGWELHEAIRYRPRQHKVDKTLPSAFCGTDLGGWLTENKINTLCVVGYMTHNCVDSTIKDAFHRGLEVEFIQDASATLSYSNKSGFATAQEMHRTFSTVLQARFAAVMDTQEWLGLIDSDDAPVRDTIYQSSQRAQQVLKNKSV